MNLLPNYNPQNPLVIQRDQRILLDPSHPQFDHARQAIVTFSELESSADTVHTYRITPLSLWNACSVGLTAQEICDTLNELSKYPVAERLILHIHSLAGRWGRLKLLAHGTDLLLVCDDANALAELRHKKAINALLIETPDPQRFIVEKADRGQIKQAFMAAGWPVEDLAGYIEGEALEIRLRSGDFAVRNYQRAAAEAFYAGGDVRGGSGVVVLPPGAGKTVVGITAMSLVGQSTLILTTNRTSVVQWQREILAKTHVPAELVAEYTGEHKQIAPITISTYQMLTYRAGDEQQPHLDLFSQREWGLIIYDEVHSLPAPIFRATADIQSKRRLGLTATLIREDGRERDVFTLIGPKKYEQPWRELEQRGWIAEAQCYEVRVRLPSELRMSYASAKPREQSRIAAENPAKLALVQTILGRYAGTATLIIGQYLAQLEQIAQALGVPLITGKSPQAEREQLFAAFRRGEPMGKADRPVLVLSKVGNFALDLPDAALLIQVSGTFGSRQEEAQRLGRVLRPKAEQFGAAFYTIVSQDTQEVGHAFKRQLFLAEQGYSYQLLSEQDFIELSDA
jgi:DNA excision repair protein ERCC-3